MNTPKTADPLPVIRAPTAPLSSMARMARSISGRIRRETGSWKYTLLSVLMQLGIAYAVALLVFQIGSLLGA